MPRRYQQRGAEGPTHLDGILPAYQEGGPLGIGTGGACGRAKPLPIAGMGEVVSGDFLDGGIECIIEGGIELSNPSMPTRMSGSSPTFPWTKSCDANGAQPA